MCVYAALQERADVTDGKAALIDGTAGTNGVQSDASSHSDDPSASGNDQIDQVTDNVFQSHQSWDAVPYSGGLKVSGKMSTASSEIINTQCPHHSAAKPELSDNCQ